MVLVFGAFPSTVLTPSEPLHVFFSQVGDASFAKGRDDQCPDATDLVGDLAAPFLSGSLARIAWRSFANLPRGV